MAMLTGRVQISEDSKPTVIKVGTRPILEEKEGGKILIDKKSNKEYEVVDLLKAALNKIKEKAAV